MEQSSLHHSGLFSTALSKKTFSITNEGKTKENSLKISCATGWINEHSALNLTKFRLLFYDDPQAKELYRKLLEPHDVATRDTILADLVNHLAETMNFDGEIRPSDFSRGLYVE